MTQASPRRAIIPIVVQQHVDDAAILYSTRSALLGSPHTKLHHLRRFDDRLAAHLEGLAIAGEQAKPMCQAALEQGAAGPAFVAAIRALENQDTQWLKQLMALADAVPACRAGLTSAFGWSEPTRLQGVVAELLDAGTGAERAIGIAACAMHRIDPNLGPARRLEDADPLARARAYRAAGELGKREFLSRLAAATHDEDPACQQWAAWAAVLLGDRQEGLERLSVAARQEGPFRSRAFQLSLLAMTAPRAHEHLRALAQDAAQIRWLVRGAGLVGDPTYLPWLMKHMSDVKLARLAAESFSLITGADLSLLDLERKPPAGIDAGPNDDPNDANVALDEDDGLPWPDAERVEHWWSQNSSRFVAGQRYFVGAPVTREHCIEVLRTGYQRQRILAAHHLCLLEPGSVLFEWRAPAWRQTQALSALA
jgi:uncharacterized protein (TIGR02270 family)